ncbi:DUF4411 family protein [Sulfuricurvum sp.]|uniref:DUF4411 family protein n=1 Tax=Sulfuricurvum sp. TaxID=2025608 RepID=UPI00261FA2A8|nr:DUF4411 family protein [Sulfuricurvum sp.]MDD2781945.1 DUF4411 family protein [Sulfuricurvum sp.]
MAYCLDANTLIEAKNIHYGMDFCPGFWDMIDAQAQSGVLFSITQVCDELLTGGDELSAWVEERKKDPLFIETDDTATQLVFGEIAEFVVENYSEAQASHFLSGADPWLIAKCKAIGATLVTKEVLAPGAKKVKIPNICQEFGVSFIPTHEMIRILGNRYILEEIR